MSLRFHEFVDAVYDITRWNLTEGRTHGMRDIPLQADGYLRGSVISTIDSILDSAGEAADTRTPEQVRALRQLVERYHAYFPNAVIVGHHDLNPGKPCPCYDAAKEYADLQPKTEG